MKKIIIFITMSLLVSNCAQIKKLFGNEEIHDKDSKGIAKHSRFIKHPSITGVADSKATILVSGLSNIKTVAIASDNSLYVLDGNNKVSKVLSNGTTQDIFTVPNTISVSNIVIDTNNNIYYRAYTNNSYKIVKYTSSTATSEDIVTSTTLGLLPESISNLTLDSLNNLYYITFTYTSPNYTYKIVKIGANNVSTDIATATPTAITSPAPFSNLLVDTTNSLYYVGYLAENGNYTYNIRKSIGDSFINLVSTTTTNNAVISIQNLILDRANNVYYLDSNQLKLVKISSNGAVNDLITVSTSTMNFLRTANLLFDATGNGYYLDGNYLIQILADASKSNVYISTLTSPTKLIIDTNNVLYVANSNSITKITP